MIRTKILGLGCYVPDRVVTNDELPFLDDQHVRQADAADRDRRRVDPAAHRHRGAPLRAERRHDCGPATSRSTPRSARSPTPASRPTTIDCIIFGTLSPDIHFPGTAVVPAEEARHRGRERAARASTSASSARRSSTACRWPTRSSAPACTSASCWSAPSCTATRSTSRRAAATSRCCSATAPARWCSARWRPTIRAPASSTRRRRRRHGRDGPLPQDLRDRAAAVRRLRRATIASRTAIMYPHMDGKRVFLNAVRGMVMSTQAALAKTGLTWNDIQWFVPHQANLRINEKVAESPRSRPRRSSTRSSSTATPPPRPCRSRSTPSPAGQGQARRPDLSSVFGSGFTWGAAIFRV